MIDEKGGFNIDIRVVIFILILWTLFIFSVGLGLGHNKTSCNQEVISQLSGVNERLDSLSMGDEYIIKYLNDNLK